jgi:predicted acetyltransferase
MCTTNEDQTVGLPLWLQSGLVLRKPSKADGPDIVLAHEDFEDMYIEFAFGLSSLFDGDYARWMDWVNSLDTENPLEPSYVRTTFLIARDRRSQLSGRVAVRYELDAQLAKSGGHVGVAVLKGHRRTGYGRELLQFGVTLAHERGVSTVILICDATNVASRSLLESTGAHLLDQVHTDGRTMLRFSVDSSSDLESVVGK